MKYLYVFIGLIIIKFIYNLLQYINNFRLYKIWLSFFDKSSNINAVTYTAEIKSHLLNANIKDSKQPISIRTGYNMIANTKYSMIDNIFTNNEDVFTWYQFAFLEARGVYRSRMKDSFKLSYWIKLIIFLPKNIIQYLGLNAETIFTKIFQLIYWIIDSVLIVYYRDELLLSFQKIFDQLFK